MKKYLWSIYFVFMCSAAFAEQHFLSGYDYSMVSEFNDYNTYVESGAVVSSAGNTITIDGPIYLYNSGRIDGGINAERNLTVYNSGVISGVITPNGGNVVQVITSPSEMTYINVAGNDYQVEVQNYNNANLSDIQATNAASFIIKGSSIVMNSFDEWQNWDQNVTVGENVVLIVIDPNSIQSGQIVSHTLTDPAGFNVKVPNMSKMYKTDLRSSGGGLVLYIVRETDYDVIFGEEDGETSLEELRAMNSNDKLLSALDVAQDAAEIERLKNMSYRFNHKILLRPLKTLNGFSLMNSIDEEAERGIGIVPHYVFSDTLSSVGGRIYVGYQHDDLYLYAGLNVDRFDYENSLNKFSGLTYGLDIKAKKHFNNFWLGGMTGVGATNFTANYVSKTDKIKNNPFGLNWYVGMDVGYDFDIAQDVILSPFIGTFYQSFKVTDVSDSESYLRSGANVKYSFVIDGIKYEYALTGAAGTNSTWFADAKVGFVSITDSAGVSVNASMLKDDFDYSYKLALNAKILF
jgi:hypothetical protein